jgi:hypothetical protein
VDRKACADAFVRTVLSLGDASLRARYVASLAESTPIDVLANTLDAVCERAEQAEAAAREALVAIVDALNGEGLDDRLQALREQAAGNSLLALERLVRLPPKSHRPTSSVPPREREPGETREGERRGQAVPLGARKSLARRPDRDLLQRLLRDPHPDVVRRCLANPRLVEDDVVRLAARRPGRPEGLVEIARSPWVHRPRVRLALVMNPGTPAEVVARLVGLLIRPELTMAARSPGVAAGVRALCLEHLERRPPVSDPSPSEPDLQ